MMRLEVSWSCPVNSLPGKTITATFHLRNPSEKAFPGGRLWVKPNSFIQLDSCAVPAIRSLNGNVRVELVFHTNRVHIDAIPTIVQMELKDTAGTVVWAGNLHQKMSFFLEPLITLAADVRPFANILLFGLAGSGKSSFLNSACTLVDTSDVPLTPAGVAQASGHVTKEVFRYAMNKYNQNFNIQFVDCWGLTPDTYNDQSLDMLLSGELPTGFKSSQELKDPAVLERLAAFNASKDPADRVIHAILFFVPQAMINDPAQAGPRQRLKVFYQRLASANYQPLVVISKIDEISKPFLDNPLGTYPEVEALRQKASAGLGVAPKDICFNLNYFQHAEKVFDIDRLNYRIMREALQRARDRRVNHSGRDSDGWS